MVNLDWFDNKYKEGGRPSLEDKAGLFRGLDIKINDRARESIESYLQQCLFELEKEYKPSLHVLTYEFLFCFAPIINLDNEKYKGYLNRFKKAMKKHKDKVVFQCNFEEEQ